MNVNGEGPRSSRRDMSAVTSSSSSARRPQHGSSSSLFAPPARAMPDYKISVLARKKTESEDRFRHLLASMEHSSQSLHMLTTDIEEKSPMTSQRSLTSNSARNEKEQQEKGSPTTTEAGESSSEDRKKRAPSLESESSAAAPVLPDNELVAKSKKRSSSSSKRNHHKRTSTSGEHKHRKRRHSSRVEKEGHAGDVGESKRRHRSSSKKKKAHHHEHKHHEKSKRHRSRRETDGKMGGETDAVSGLPFSEQETPRASSRTPLSASAMLTPRKTSSKRHRSRRTERDEVMDDVVVEMVQQTPRVLSRPSMSAVARLSPPPPPKSSRSLKATVERMPSPQPQTSESRRKSQKGRSSKRSGRSSSRQSTSLKKPPPAAASLEKPSPAASFADTFMVEEPTLPIVVPIPPPEPIQQATSSLTLEPPPPEAYGGPLFVPRDVQPMGTAPALAEEGSQPFAEFSNSFFVEGDEPEAHHRITPTEEYDYDDEEESYEDMTDVVIVAKTKKATPGGVKKSARAPQRIEPTENGEPEIGGEEKPDSSRQHGNVVVFDTSGRSSKNTPISEEQILNNQDSAKSSSTPSTLSAGSSPRRAGADAVAMSDESSSSPDESTSPDSSQERPPLKESVSMKAQRRPLIMSQRSEGARAVSEWQKGEAYYEAPPLRQYPLAAYDEIEAMGDIGGALSADQIVPRSVTVPPDHGDQAIYQDYVVPIPSNPAPPYPLRESDASVPSGSSGSSSDERGRSLGDSDAKLLAKPPRIQPDYSLVEEGAAWESLYPRRSEISAAQQFSSQDLSGSGRGAWKKRAQRSSELSAAAEAAMSDGHSDPAASDSDGSRPRSSRSLSSRDRPDMSNVMPMLGSSYRSLKSGTEKPQRGLDVEPSLRMEDLYSVESDDSLEMIKQKERQYYKPMESTTSLDLIKEKHHGPVHTVIAQEHYAPTGVDDWTRGNQSIPNAEILGVVGDSFNADRGRPRDTYRRTSSLNSVALAEKKRKKIARQKRKEYEKKKKRGRWIKAGVVGVVLALLVGLITALAISLADDDSSPSPPAAGPIGEAPPPTPSPTVAGPTQPSPYPFTLAGMTDLVLAVMPDSRPLLNDPDTPQAQALTWLASSANQPYSSDADRLFQRYALATFYYAMSGEWWDNNAGWLTAENECDWYSTAGGPCNQQGDFRVLDLKFNSLIGVSIPEELAFVPSLVWIDLSGNKISEVFPPYLGSFTALQVLFLPNNAYTGTLSAEIAQLRNLEFLSLRSNFISGTVPAELGNMANLNWIDLSFNDIRGQIPAQIANLNELNTFRIAGNVLSGSLPITLSTSITELGLAGNKFVGSIPPTAWSPLDLEVLDLSNNPGINGTIPSTLWNSISFGGAVVDLAGTSIAGAVPFEVCDVITSTEGRLLVDCAEVACDPSCCAFC